MPIEGGGVGPRNFSQMVPLCLKLSEKWDLQDYEKLKSVSSCWKGKNVLLTHGTDNLSFFAPFIDLLSKVNRFKGIVVASQKDHSKPSRELDVLRESTFLL